jgi:hypothetical protein
LTARKARLAWGASAITHAVSQFGWAAACPILSCRDIAYGEPLSKPRGMIVIASVDANQCAEADSVTGCASA